MAKIETAIRDAIARGTRKQIRLIAGPTRRELRRLRQLVRRLRGDVAALRGVAVQWQQAAARPRPLEVTEAESKAARLSPRLIRRLRTRLGLSQATIHQYVTALYRHFSVGSRAQLLVTIMRRTGRDSPKQLPPSRELNRRPGPQAPLDR